MTGLDGVPPIGDIVAAPKQQRLSQIFKSLAAAADGPVSIGRICGALGDRSFAALLLLFAAINLVPVPPGATLILALPLILVSGQMVLGFATPWLPASISARSIGPARFRAGCDRLVPWLEWLEEFVRPRWWPLPDSHAERVVGLVALVLSFAVFLPAPFLNWIPALAIAVVGLALSERDGVFFAAGLAIGALSLLVIGTVLGAAGAMAGAMLGIGF